MKNLHIKSILSGALIIASGSLFSQTNAERIEIVKNYDLVKLKILENKFNKEEVILQEQLKKTALKNNWPLKITLLPDGNMKNLIGISNSGKPIYYESYNEDAAVSTRARALNTGGSLGLDVNGENMTAYVWDGGIGYLDHVEYEGRYSVGDGTTQFSGHSGHVAGTIMAAGIDADAKGMASKANVIAYRRDNDLAEATSAAADGMLISNHSYGPGGANVDSWEFGAYHQKARDWDELMYNAPYYLMVAAAGNNGHIAPKPGVLGFVDHTHPTAA